MRFVLELLAFVLLLFIIVMLVRLVFDWVQVFAHDWRPRGAVLVVAEATYTITDPPLRALRRVIPPLSLGSIRLDLAFLVLMLGASFLRALLLSMASSI